MVSSEGNKDVVPNKGLSMDQSSTSGAKRKRGRPRKYEYPIYELPQKAQPIQSAPPLHSTQGGSAIRHDGVHVSQTSGGNVGPKMCTVHVFPAQQIQANRPGRPGNSANLVKTSDNQATFYSSAPLQRNNSGKDGIVGKHFVGKMTTNCPGFSLITVKVKGNRVLRGWVPNENNLCPITSNDDIAPELPILRPSQVRKQASAVHMQAARPVAIDLEDVITLAKPLQMRKPADNTIAKHTAPLPPRPSYMGSDVIAALPLSVAPSIETSTLAKQSNEPVIPNPSVAMPLKSVQPALVSCKQIANQNLPAGEKSVKEFQKDFESSNETEKSSVKGQKGEKPNTLVDVAVKNSPGESSGQTQHLDATIPNEIKKRSDVEDQPNSENSEYQSSMEPSDITEQSKQLKTETSILKGVDGSKSGTSDDIHSVHDEHEVRDDSK